MKAPAGKLLIQREAPPEKVGAIFVPVTAFNPTGFATVTSSGMPEIPVGVRAICTMEMGEKVGDHFLLREINSVYAWFDGSELKLPPERIAVLARKDEHEDDFIYVPGNFIRRDEAIGGQQRWVHGSVYLSTFDGLQDGESIVYYEAAETLNLDSSDWDKIPDGYELRIFPNRPYEPIASVVCQWIV